MTSDIQRRILEHNSGFVKSTKYRRLLELLQLEEFPNKNDALSREKQLKNKKGNLPFLLS